jgi:hypothetical protein
MLKIKFLSIALVLGLILPGCSSTSKNERAYYKYLKKANAARGVQRKQAMKNQRAKMPSLRPAPTPPPSDQGIVTSPENQ